MFRRQKSPVISATHCDEMESLRMALEVMFGERVRFRQIDFNTGRGAVRLGEEEKKFSFVFARPELFNFSIWNESGEPKEWYTARFDVPEEVMVIKDSNPYMRGKFIMWWVGKSFVERREEPLYKEQIMRCAAVRGISMEEYLNANE